MQSHKRPYLGFFNLKSTLDTFWNFLWDTQTLFFVFFKYAGIFFRIWQTDHPTPGYFWSYVPSKKYLTPTPLMYQTFLYAFVHMD